jgi:hypothetical protein
MTVSTTTRTQKKTSLTPCLHDKSNNSNHLSQHQSYHKLTPRPSTTRHTSSVQYPTRLKSLVPRPKSQVPRPTSYSRTQSITSYHDRKSKKSYGHDHIHVHVHIHVLDQAHVLTLAHIPTRVQVLEGAESNTHSLSYHNYGNAQPSQETRVSKHEENYSNTPGIITAAPPSPKPSSMTSTMTTTTHIPPKRVKDHTHTVQVLN